jgi:hypothetical protein
VHRTTRSIALAATVVTVGALALPVSAALADTQATDTTVTATDGSTATRTTEPTDTETTEPTDTETTEPTDTETTEPTDTETTEPTDSDETDQDETDQDENGSTGQESGDDASTPTTTAPAQKPATPWHVKARLLDRDSAVVTWRDADPGDVTFSVVLVPSGSTGAAALPVVTATGSGRSVQSDGLVAGTRYRATVTATTTDGTAVSAASNTLVAPKPKHAKHTTATKPAKPAKQAKPAKAVEHAKPAKTVRSGRTGHAAPTTAHGSKAKHGGKAGTAKHGAHRRG